MTVCEQNQDVKKFIDTLSKNSLPAMSSSVNSMRQLTADVDSRVSQLTEQVLKDPTLTARILQIANSPMYRGVAGPINTVTRAIVMMGYTTVRDLILSVKLLDNVLSDTSTCHLQNVMAKSFHAAMQAKNMVVQSKYGVKEEVFISSLLFHLGEISVLSRNDKLSAKLDDLISNKGLTPSMAAKDVLGFSFQDLTLGLASNWSLGQMIQDAIKTPDAAGLPVQAILLGEELSQVAGLGWDSNAVKEVVLRIAKYNSCDFGVMLNQVKHVADHSREVANLYGAEAVKHLIPPSHYTTATAKKLKVITFEDAPADGESSDRPHKMMVELDITPEMIEAALDRRPLPNTEDMLQHAESNEDAEMAGEATLLTIAENRHQEPEKIPTEALTQALHIEYMHRIGNLLNSNAMNVNDMFALIVEAMIEAVGMKRVVLGLLSKDRKKITAKLFGGDADDSFKEKFSFSMSEDNAFSYCLRQAQPIWIGAKENQGKDYLRTSALIKVLKTDTFFVSPIIISRKPMGLFYGDFQQGELTQQKFLNFTVLARQASIALSMMSRE